MEAYSNMQIRSVFSSISCKLRPAQLSLLAGLPAHTDCKDTRCLHLQVKRWKIFFSNFMAYSCSSAVSADFRHGGRRTELFYSAQLKPQA